MVNIRRLLIQKLFGVHAVPNKTQVEIQRVYTGLGAEFGQAITNDNITFALKREPVAHRVVFAVAHDVFDNWFEVEPLEQDVDQAEFNEAVQKVLLMLNAKDVFTQAALFERAYGWSIVVIGYQDKGVTLEDPVLMPEKIVSLEAYSPPMMADDPEIDKDKNSPRFGLPEIYKIKIAKNDEVKVHFSRIIHFATRRIEPGYKGVSVLEPIWDDLTVLRNIRWGMGQTMYRYGSGFPVVMVKGATKEQIEDYKREWGPLTAQTSMWTDENTTIDFKGLAGRALDPEPYYNPIMENISAGTSIPMAILRGAQAGALTGSEVNEREYFKLISDCQSRYEPGIMQLIDRLMETRQIPDVHYKINWFGAFEINPRDQAAAELDRIRSLTLKTNWMTINELREVEGLKAVVGGDVVLGLLKLQAGGEPLQASVIKQTSKRKLQIEEEYGKPWDRLLSERVSRGDSVNKICRDLGISTSTFYAWVEEIKHAKEPTVIYVKPKMQVQPDFTGLTQTLDSLLTQKIAGMKPKQKRIKKTLTDEEGKKLVEETLLEIEY